MRFLLRPGWVALIVAVVAFVVACYTYLAPWQFGREAQRDTEQRAIDTATAIAPVPLGDLSPAGTGVTPETQWRQVTLTGTYQAQAQALVRLRVVEGKPASEVLTPLRTDDGRLITVDRGSIPTPDGAGVPVVPAPPSGPVTLTGRLRLDENDPRDRGVIEEGGMRQQWAADSRTLGPAVGLPLEPGVVLLAAGEPGVLAPIPVAPTSAGSAPFTNFSYALQWLTFGAIAVFALVWFIRLERMQRGGPERPPRSRATRRAEFRAALSGDDQD